MLRRYPTAAVSHRISHAGPAPCAYPAEFLRMLASAASLFAHVHAATARCEPDNECDSDHMGSRLAIMLRLDCGCEFCSRPLVTHHPRRLSSNCASEILRLIGPR